MLKSKLSRAFEGWVQKGTLRFDVPLAPFTSFKIGGPADAFATPDTIAALGEILKFCLENELPYFILGKGSNLLVSDKGIRALVISMQNFNKITRDESYVSAFAGISLAKLCDFARREGLSGLEFAHGIPGSVGGAVYMNAGAYGGEIKDLLYCSKYLLAKSEALTGNYPVRHLKAKDHLFGYRSSVFQSEPFLLVSSVFKLSEDEPDEILKRMQDIHKQRFDKQPMELPSAGSVFKRPPGHFAGKLIEDCQLKGYRIGDAAISDKHCGFIVNLGKATANDVLKLIRHSQDTVFERFGLDLEPEIRLVGEW